MFEREPIVIDDVSDIVQLIMTQHWDMAACMCWVCCAGRVAGLGATHDFLGWRDQGFDQVHVDDEHWVYRSSPRDAVAS